MLFFKIKSNEEVGSVGNQEPNQGELDSQQMS